MRAMVAAILAVLTLTGCLGTGDGGDVSAVPLPLSQLEPTRTQLGRTQVLGILRLRAARPWFGGWSGMDWDGDGLTVISDTGWWGRFHLRTDADLRPVAVDGLTGGPLGGVDTSAKDQSDAEEVLRVPQGWLVSFERRHRLWLYSDDLGGDHLAVTAPAGMAGLPDNEGVETLARLKDGRIIAIAEGAEGEATTPAWIGPLGGPWRQLVYSHVGAFHPTGAATLPNGDLLVVERSFSLLAGMAMRLRRIPAAQLDGGEGGLLTGEELAQLSLPLTVDNFEAVAVRQRADGRVVALVLSDDNFNPMQSTLLMALLLP